MIDINLDLWFIFIDNNLLLVNDMNSFTVPTFDKTREFQHNLKRVYNIGRINDISCYCGELSSNVTIPDYFETLPLKEVAKKLNAEIFSLCGKASQIIHWDQTHQFCGKCGSKTINVENEFAKKCPSCGFISYPRISPAIIVGIKKGNKMLLAHNKNFPNNVHSTIAGFLDPNETLDQCIKREVFEEVGIKIKNIEYFNSQPWPYPNSIMIGFTAEYESGEISVDGEEIVHADWYDKDTLPNLPDETTIARQIINKLLKL